MLDKEYQLQYGSYFAIQYHGLQEPLAVEFFFRELSPYIAMKCELEDDPKNEMKFEEAEKMFPICLETLWSIRRLRLTRVAKQ